MRPRPPAGGLPAWSVFYPCGVIAERIHGLGVPFKGVRRLARVRVPQLDGFVLASRGQPAAGAERHATDAAVVRAGDGRPRLRLLARRPRPPSAARTEATRTIRTARPARAELRTVASTRSDMTRSPAEKRNGSRQPAMKGILHYGAAAAPLIPIDSKGGTDSKGSPSPGRRRMTCCEPSSPRVHGNAPTGPAAARRSWRRSKSAACSGPPVGLARRRRSLLECAMEIRTPRTGPPCSSAATSS